MFVTRVPVDPFGAGGGSRRDLLRTLLAAAGVAAVASAVAAARGHGRQQPSREGEFSEVYRGRRIRGVRVAAGAPWQVTVDERPLHLMRRADGSWLSMVDHYQSYPTPLAAARGAVDELAPSQHLLDMHPAGRPGMDPDMDMGGHRGAVHA
ncbi:tyrosinase co-factor MelC1 [Actinobacteria bacterium OK074]|nr:tyrosinase co-factor MelC1 [Actinobacteria bacterium OK074]